MKTAFSAFPLAMSEGKGSSVSEGDFKGLVSKVDGLNTEVGTLRQHIAHNRHAIARLIDVYTVHSPLFESANIYTVYQLAALNGNERRSALSKMAKSEHWPDDPARQLTSDQFKKICEAASVVIEE